MLNNQANTDFASIRLGRQIRDLRKSKGITLSTMAQHIGRSVGYVSQVERGLSDLPIPVLQKISALLGVQIAWFFHSCTQAPLDEQGVVVRANARRQLDFAGTGIHEQLLSPNLSGDLLMILTTLSPHAQSDKEPRQRQGEEAGYIQSGQLELTLGDKQFSLTTGDSFSINSNAPHQVRNPSTTENCVVLWVITPSSY